MTASPQQYAHREPMWWVATDQGVVLAGPFPDEITAREGGNAVAARLREAMRRERYSEVRIAERVRALRVNFGVRVHPHGGFERCERASGVHGSDRHSSCDGRGQDARAT